MPFIIAVSGFKNSGKTTLCRKLFPLLKDAGLDVAYVKRTHEEVLSPEGTDSGQLAEVSGAVALWGPDGLRIEDSRKDLDPGSLAARFFPGRHLLLLEGGKNIPLPKIWVGSPEAIPEEVSGVVAFYDRDNPCEKERHFCAGQEKELARLVLAMVRKAEASPAEVYSREKRIPVKAFVGEFIAGALSGMLRSLKGDFDPEEGISVHIRSLPGE
ncbi:MAG: molybdopterin-guanine dinucleotide biosynthesis protein MobB [Thermovirgaceae bacterium]|nr:molybdopterin-guanine dinucleotide biosynthesis protein MobB [Synergistales bacterium]MDI9392590.1 molybdopterin-guanine dinucleotide biosynthesis protein MobB [Synergistota bacterium]NLV65266.1 molybdopterin-guanine dinucleotide biosynthesis protein B [Synergistaceae bacterium]HRW87722.1 molybdopterin-guanine dinucleotide biosynthesis protein MobB [Thermovirgaceae bacterium]MDD3133517.1 molybdopterin-guanine dinucleotide biosynthesis protein MobB [Synergistales bacterium]